MPAWLHDGLHTGREERELRIEMERDNNETIRERVR
jgi:hypothetical protein